MVIGHDVVTNLSFEPGSTKMQSIRKSVRIIHYTMAPSIVYSATPMHQIREIGLC